MNQLQKKQEHKLFPKNSTSTILESVSRENAVQNQQRQKKQQAFPSFTSQKELSQLLDLPTQSHLESDLSIDQFHQSSQILSLDLDSLDRPEKQVSAATKQQRQASKQLKLSDLSNNASNGSDTLMVGKHEIMIHDLLDDDGQSPPPKVLDQKELTNCFLLDQVQQLKRRLEQSELQAAQLREDSAKWRRIIGEMDLIYSRQVQQIAEQRAVIEGFQQSPGQDEAARQLSVEQLVEQNRRLSDELTQLQGDLTCRDSLLEQQRQQTAQLERQLLANGSAREGLTQRVQRLEQDVATLKAELRMKVIHYNKLTHVLIRRQKASEAQILALGSLSCDVQTEYQPEYYYREKNVALEENAQQLSKELERAQQSLQQQQSQEKARRQESREFIIEQNVRIQQLLDYLHGIYAQIHENENYRNWQSQQRSSCFPALQSVFFLAQHFSKLQCRKLWKLVDLANFGDYANHESAEDQVSALLSRHHDSKFEIIRQYDQQFEVKLKDSLKEYYREYYLIIQSDEELSSRSIDVADRYYVSDDTDDALTRWLMTLFFMWVLNARVCEQGLNRCIYLNDMLMFEIIVCD